MNRARQISMHRILPLIVIAVALLATNAMALIEVSKGNDPVTDNNWPAGSVALANLKTRMGWWEGPPFGGGERHSLYHGAAAEFKDALDLFARIQSPKLSLVIHDGGPSKSPFLDTPADWTFTVWNPDSWKHLHAIGNRLGADFGKELPPPVLDVYVGDKGLDISKVEAPKNVTVTDERADVAGFKDGSAVIGDIIDLESGKPIANATIELASQKAYEEWEPATTVHTDAAGHFQITKAPKGAFGVIASADGYAPRMLGYIELHGNTFKKVPGALAKAAKLSGTTVDQDGEPTPNITIRADGPSGPKDEGYLLPKHPRVTSDATGHFEITGLPVGHVQLYAYADHYLIADALKIYAVPLADVKVGVVATGTIKGRILDPAGKPDARGNISLHPDGGDKPGTFGGSSNVSPDGTFSFENVPPGKYTLSLQVTNPGPAGTIDTLIVVKAGETNEVELHSK